MSYNKIFTTYEQQIEILKKRGLRISDKNQAIKFLQNVHYYRLSGYFEPFQSAKDCFKHDISFDDIKNLYEFDTALKSLTLFYIHQLECSLRAKISYHHSRQYGVYGYLNPSNFKKIKSKKDKTLTVFDGIKQKIDHEQSRANERYIEHIKEKYETKVLPIWILVEIISFSTLSKIFKILHTEIKNLIIQEYQLTIDTSVFENWLEQMVIIRNKIAHCARLWDYKLSKGFKYPKKSDGFLYSGVPTQSIFFALSVLAKVLQQPSIKIQFKNLLNKYPNTPYKTTEIPRDWESLKPWKEL